MRKTGVLDKLKSKYCVLMMALQPMNKVVVNPRDEVGLEYIVLANTWVIMESQPVTTVPKGHDEIRLCKCSSF